MISTLLNHPLQRIKEERFAAAKGAAMMAGITSGLFYQFIIEKARMACFLIFLVS